MSEFQWNEKLSIGVQPMDQDHQQIIALMNSLDQAHEKKAGVAEIDRAFKTLANFTRKHFSDEEAYMEKIGYTGLQSHKMIHAKLLASMDEHYQKFRSSSQLDEQVFIFLRFWLKSHICGIDRKYAEMALSQTVQN